MKIVVNRGYKFKAIPTNAQKEVANVKNIRNQTNFQRFKKHAQIQKY